MGKVSPRREEENQRIREERLEKIVAAASVVFARKGLAGTKITDIAAAVGMSHGLIYHYFKSKEEVFATIASRAAEAASMVTLMALEQPATPWERIEWLAGLMSMGLDQQPEYWDIVIQAVTGDAVPPQLKQLVWEKGAESRANMTRLVADAQAAGQCVAGNPEQLAVTFLSCVQGMALHISAARAGGYEGPLPDMSFALRILKA